MKEVKFDEQGESLEFKQRVLNILTGKVPDNVETVMGEKLD